MGGKNDAPDPPDYGPLIEASKQQMEYNFELGKDQLEWAKEQYGKDSVVAQKVIDAALARAAENDATAKKDRDRYETLFQPLENDLAADATSYGTAEREEYEAGKAQASVAETFEASRRAAAQNLESFGVDPSSTRYAALDAGSRIAQAAAAAAAGNTAREGVQDKARSLRTEAITVGQGYPASIATQGSTALQSGNQGINSALATTGSGANTMGTSTQYGAIGNQALSNMGNIMNSGYEAQLAQYNANQQSSSGLGALAGAGLGLLGASSNAAGAAGLGMFLEEGGAVPTAASPTAGKAIDDVPARLTAGEFVIPKDVLQWKGEEFFQKLIEGSRKSKPEAPAQPQRRALPAEAPHFTSRPASALPMAA
jgi:hypothetical protein